MKATRPHLVRARVWSTTDRSVRIRNGVSPSGWIRMRLDQPIRTWHYVVYFGDDVILYDNTGSYEKVLRLALERVATLRHLVVRDHVLKPYNGYFPHPPVRERHAGN